MAADTVRYRGVGTVEERVAKMTHGTDIRERLKSGLANTGRAAGSGISYDRYDEESTCRPGPIYRGPVRFPSDGIPFEELNGPVKVYKGGAK